MSKEQSPPVRKVIPYKSGRRKSPFADMALQFSGTALDVAIQQREEESRTVQPPDDEQLRGETAEPQDTPVIVSEVEQGEEAQPTLEITPAQEASNVSDLPASPEQTRIPEIAITNTKKISSRPVTSKKKVSPPPSPDSLFQSFIDRWKHGLHRGQLKMCEVLYNKTHAVGNTDCETSFSVLMRESGLSRRQAFLVISQLEQMGFVERIPTSKHSTRKGTGSHIRFHLTPKS